jgi:hypothetical protein
MSPSDAFRSTRISIISPPFHVYRIPIGTWRSSSSDADSLCPLQRARTANRAYGRLASLARSAETVSQRGEELVQAIIEVKERIQIQVADREIARQGSKSCRFRQNRFPIHYSDTKQALVGNCSGKKCSPGCHRSETRVFGSLTETSITAIRERCLSLWMGCRRRSWWPS